MESSWFRDTFKMLIDEKKQLQSTISRGHRLDNLDIHNPAEKVKSIGNYDVEEEDHVSTDTFYEHPHLKVPILPEDEKDKAYYETIEIGYAWLQGFRPDRYWTNTTECFDRMTNYTYI